jgi:hypothetical protein
LLIFAWCFCDERKSGRAQKSGELKLHIMKEEKQYNEVLGYEENEIYEWKVGFFSVNEVLLILWAAVVFLRMQILFEIIDKNKDNLF